jgi:iron complex outermembrane recepter protein
MTRIKRFRVIADCFLGVPSPTDTFILAHCQNLRGCRLIECVEMGPNQCASLCACRRAPSIWPLRLATSTTILALLFAAPSVARPQDPSGQTEMASNDAQQNLKQMTLEQLGEIEVTTQSKEPTQVWKTPAAIYVITQEDIRRSGYTTIPDLLRLAPGVDVARIDSDHWAVGIRGSNGEFSKSLLVLIDGRSVYSPLFGGVYWNVHDTLFEDIDRIEVIRGPGGTIWGSNAVNGIINIITKNAADTHGSLVTADSGNVDQGEVETRYGSSRGAKLDYRGYAKGFIRGPESHPDGQNFDEWRMGQLGFRTDSQPTNRDSLRVQGDTYLGRDGERVAISFYSPPSVEVLDGPHHTSGGNIVVSWRRVLSGNSDLELRSYFDRTTRFSPQLDETRNTFDLDFLYHRLVAGRHDVLLGAGGRWSPDNIGLKFVTLDFEPHQQTDQMYSWFAQDQITIVPNALSLVLGSKFDHNNRSGFEVQPNGRLLWTPAPHQTLWAAVTRAVRTPARLDQDLQLTDYLGISINSLPVFFRVLGTSSFRSEELLGTEIGYRTLLTKHFYLDTAIFRNDYNDLYGYGPGVVLQETTPAPTHLVLQEPLTNALKGDTSGGEIAPDWKPTQWLEFKGSYSYLHLYVHDKPGFTDNLNTVSDNGSSPHNQVLAQSLMTLPKGVEVDATYRYVSSLPAQTVKAYSTADAHVAWHISHQWSLSASGQNLFQPAHAEFGTDVNTIVGIKRAFYGNLVWTR